MKSRFGSGQNAHREYFFLHDSARSVAVCRVGFAAVGLESPRLGWVFAVIGLDWPRWVGFVAVRLDLSRLGWIHRYWARFAVVGNDSPLLGTIRRRLVAFALAALNSPLWAPLADVSGAGFAIVDPNCRFWGQSIVVQVGLVGGNCDRFSLARAEKLSEIEGKR
jgi:hypothetical protein